MSGFPSGCQDAACEQLEPAEPRELQLRVLNDTDETIYLYGGCGAPVVLERGGEHVRRLPDVYEAPLCEDVLGDMAGGAQPRSSCVPVLIPVEPGEAFVDTWSSTQYEVASVQDSCSEEVMECNREVASPDGGYRMTVRLWLQCPHDDGCECDESGPACFLPAPDVVGPQAQVYEADFTLPRTEPVDIVIE